MFVNRAQSANQSATSVWASRLYSHFRLSVRPVHVESRVAIFIIFYACFPSKMTPAGLILRVIHALIALHIYLGQFLSYIGKSLQFPAKEPRFEDLRREAKSLRKLPIHVGPECLPVNVVSERCQ